MPKGPGIIAIIATSLLLGFASARADEVTPEDVVKATFVYRFASFVEWPESAFSAADAPMQICVLGASTMQRVLLGVVRNQTVNGRAFAVRPIAGMADLSSCHILYAAAPISTDAMRQSQHLPVLTVTDAAYGPGARGVMHFVIVDHRVRFHIDDAGAATGGLNISSRLLSLALSVRRRAGS